jgi:hypothetical protein
MNAVSYVAFKDELEKIAGWGDLATHAAEVGGLGILAAPTIQKMRGKKMSEKGEHAAELGGLGVLAAPSAAHLAKHLIKRGSADPLHIALQYLVKQSASKTAQSGRAMLSLAEKGMQAVGTGAARVSQGAHSLGPSTVRNLGATAGRDAEAARKARIAEVMARNRANPNAGRMSV